MQPTTPTPRPPASPWLWVPTLYLVEAFPNSLVEQVAPVFLQQNGFAKEAATGLVATAALPWALKFLWSPLLGLRGTGRGWITASQTGIAVACAGIAAAAWLSGGAGGGAVFFVTALFLCALASATHDIAADGFYYNLDESRRGFFIGVRNAAYRVGGVLPQVLLPVAVFRLSRHFGLGVGAAWATAFAAAAAVLAALALWHRRILPQGGGAEEDVGKSGASTPPVSPQPAETPQRDDARRVLECGTSVPLCAKTSVSRPEAHFNAAAAPSADIQGRTDIPVCPANAQTAAAATGQTRMSVLSTSIVAPRNSVSPSLSSGHGTEVPAKSGTEVPHSKTLRTSAEVVGGGAFAARNTGEPPVPLSQPLSPPPPRRVFREYARTWLEFLRKEQLLLFLFFLFCFRLPEVHVTRIASYFLLDPRAKGGLALDAEQFATISGIATAAMVLGGVLGGVLVARAGLRRVIWPLVVVMHLPNLAFVALARWQPDSLWWTGAGVVVEKFGYGVGYTVFALVMLRMCDGPRRVAHYAFAASLAYLGNLLPGYWVGALAGRAGYEAFFWLTILAILPSLLATHLVRTHLVRE